MFALLVSPTRPLSQLSLTRLSFFFFASDKLAFGWSTSLLSTKHEKGGFRLYWNAVVRSVDDAIDVRMA